jgi:hypothetical protein
MLKQVVRFDEQPDDIIFTRSALTLSLHIQKFLRAVALIGAGWVWTLNGCLDSAPSQVDEDISYRAGDMLIEGFRNESITTGTIKNILVAEKGYLFSQADQMELYNLRLSILEPIPDAAEGEPQFRVASVLTATTGSYYTTDKDFGGGFVRNQGDLDLYGSLGRSVVYDTPDIRLHAQEYLYYNTANNSISTSAPYTLYNHKQKNASGHRGGFIHRFLEDGSEETTWGEESIDYKYMRKSFFDESGVFRGPDPREIPHSRGKDD